jgi:hypothetical protein
VYDDVPRSGIEAGGDGLDADVTGAWIAGEGQLVRVDESKDRVAKRISLTGTGGADVSIGGFGLWVLEEPSSASGALVETFDPMSGAPDVSRELSCSFPRRIVEVGGFIAVVSLDIPHVISAGAGVEPRLRLLDWEAGGDTVGPTSGIPFPSTELASSDNGWTLDGSTLVELDGIERLRPIRSIDLPVERPVSIAVGAGGVWVVSQSSELLRVDEDSGELDVQMEVPRGAGGDRVAVNDEAVYLLGSDGRVVRIAAPA